MEFAVEKGVTAEEIRILRKKLGLTREEFGKLVNVSTKTVERWESEKKEITGPISTVLKVFTEYPQIADNLRIPEKEYPLRLWYMFQREICTVIDVNLPQRRVKIQNYTADPIKKAFGPKDKPTFEEYEEFLESRCFPRTRDKMKLILKELDLPFYDPFMIIEKTQGRMAEDDFWIRIER